MTLKELKKNYDSLLEEADLAIGRKETIAFLNKAAKLRSKLYIKSKIICYKCNGTGYLRMSLNNANTCLTCVGKGYVYKEILHS